MGSKTTPLASMKRFESDFFLDALTLYVTLAAIKKPNHFAV